MTSTMQSPATQRENATALPTTTPKGKGAFAFLNSITHRQPKTPKTCSPIKPAEPEMHPQKEHRTSTTPYDEARWLGFFNMNAQTAPAAKTSSFTAAHTSPTPSKIALPSMVPPGSVPHVGVASALPAAKGGVSSPDFKFTFRRAPSVELSEDAQKIMAESREEAAKIRAQLASLPTVPDTEPEDQIDIANGRKIAKPKGKVGRFSDVHMAGFKKMDSIANHASAWRVDPARKPAATTSQALKRSPFKDELDKPAPAVAAGLKRSPSKGALKAEPSPFLTRSPSKLGLHQTTKQDQSAIRAEERPMPSAKRVRQSHADDAGTTRPKEQSPSTHTLVRSKSGLLRPGFSSAMSPTKSSMARVQSVRDLRATPNKTKTTTQIPALVRSTTSANLRQQATASALPRSKSMRDLNAAPDQSKPINPTPTVVAPTPSPVKTAYLPCISPVKAPELATSSPMSSDTPKRIKSILRTPNRRYTRDPVKIAAGTHLATPPQKKELYPNIPATEPIIKRVDFTNSTKEKAERDAFKAASVEPESVAYPELKITTMQDRRMTMAVVPSVSLPGAFTFRSGQEMSFGGSPKAATIRQVRTSDAGLPSAFQFTGARGADSPSKRKLDTLDEDEGATSEKENRGEDEEDHRPAKKARVFSGGGSKSAPATPVARKVPAASKLPRVGAGAKRVGGLSAARLSMLAKPKRRG